MTRRGGNSPWLIGDLAVIAAIVGFAWLALALRDSVAELGDMATGIRDNGNAIQSAGRATSREIRDGIGQAADSLASVPLAGEDLRSRVRRTGDRTGGAAEAGT